MGKTGFLIVLGLAMMVGIFGATINRQSTSSVRNYTSYYSHIAARNANNTALQLALRRLADTMAWRTGYPKLSVSGINVNLTVKEKTFRGTPNSIVLTAKSPYYPDSMSTRMETAITTVVVQPPATIPPGIHAAWTAAGPLDKSMSDMYIDGRDHDTTIVDIGPPTKYQPVANNGYYAISSADTVFVNTDHGYLGGSDRSTNPPTDIAPAYPPDSRVVETNGYPGGYYKTPDQAMGFAEGTLKKLARSGLRGGRYITNKAQLAALVTSNQPLKGVTYIEVAYNPRRAGDTVWGGVKIPDRSGGILVFHCPTPAYQNGEIRKSYPTYTAFWNNITTPTKGTFRGLMIFDKVFHFHMSCVGAVIELTPFTVVDRECGGNKDMTIAYSSKLVTAYSGWGSGGTGGGGWRDQLAVRAWRE